MISQNASVKTEFIGPQAGILDYSADFKIYDNEDIEVSVEHDNGTVTVLVINTDYTLTNVGNPAFNVDVTLIDNGQAWIDAAGLADNYKLKLEFTDNAYQDANFRDLGQLAPAVFTKVLDRLTMFILALKQNVSDVVTVFQTQIDDHEDRITDLETINSFIAPTLSHEAINFTADYDKIHIIDANLDVQLPAPINGKQIRLKSSGSFTINIVRAGAEEIEGVAMDYTLDSDLQSVTITTDGTNWFLI